ncbi:MAG: SulP family inorganic anion transporter [archaeon]|nr:SulP family inorganic anion transporter [archaeon]
MNIKKYFSEAFIFDLKAGFITAIVALPLAIAFAIASGVPPIMGLYTAIIAGILGSSFGGSRFSITGPTGAMTVIILATVNKFGIEGLLLAGLLAGILQLGFGALNFGKLVKYIPLPIISGFTSGIGVIIFIGQLANFLGLSIPPHEFIWTNVREIIFHLPNSSLLAISIALGTLVILHFYPLLAEKNRFLRNIPASILALIFFTAITIYFALDIPVVGDIPSGLPSFSLLNFNLDLVRQVLPSAFTIALLGAIEALLCAVVCDGMTNTKHDSDKELRSQGIANIVIPFFGGIPSTAAIARSAVNIREGAKTKYSGVIHALFLLLILLVFAPVAKFIPTAFLAGILMFVSLNMININEFFTISRISRSDTAVLAITFLLTVFTDLVFAVQVGMFLAIFLLFIRLTKMTDISHMEEYDKKNGINFRIYANPLLEENITIYTIHGPFFFGAMNVFDRKLNEHMHMKKPIIILRMTHVPFIDSTGVARLNSFLMERQREHKTVYLTELSNAAEKVLFRDHTFTSLMEKEHIFGTTGAAIDYAEKSLIASREKEQETK